MAPLLKPEECCILLINPIRSSITTGILERDHEKAIIARHALIQEAARLLEVPKFFVFQGEETNERDWIVQPCDRTKPRIYVVRDARSVWSCHALVTELAAEGRACLILSGFWLDGDITFAALNALADGFDVFVLMDTCPSCDKRSQCPAVNRLLQAGVVPLTTTQMVREWAEVSIEETRRSLLLRLLEPI